MKRSGFVDETRAIRPEHIRVLETLNVFGVRAHFMQQFKEYLEEEGLPTNDERIEIILPTIKNLGTQKLKTLRLPPEMDFKRDGPKPALGVPDADWQGRQITLNWYPKIQARIAPDLGATADVFVPHAAKLTAAHLAFFDWQEIDRQLQEFKNERGWFNLNLSPDACRALLQDPSWYVLHIAALDLEMDNFARISRWQEIAVALLKKYCDLFFKTKKAAWEAPQLRYETLAADDPNLVSEYRFLIDQSETEIIAKLNAIKEAVASKQLKAIEWGVFRTLWFGQHLYQPLIHFKSNHIQVSPVELNQGECDFVTDLQCFYEREKSFFEGKELYLLRNLSRGNGIGFFEAGNFHPDFILWLLVGGKQYITFVDPKGLLHSQGVDDPKISFFQTIKKIEQRCADPNVILNSFIVANTSHEQIAFWGGPGKQMSKADFEARHVLFQNEDKATYIGKLLRKMLSPV